LQKFAGFHTFQHAVVKLLILAEYAKCSAAAQSNRTSASSSAW